MPLTHAGIAQKPLEDNLVGLIQERRPANVLPHRIVLTETRLPELTVMNQRGHCHG